MNEDLTRREFIGGAAGIGTAGAVGMMAMEGSAQASAGTVLKILGISCSPRKGMTTAKATQAALDAAKAVGSRIEVELIDLGGMNIAGWSPKPPEDDFKGVLPKLEDPALAGIVIGSPVYFRGVSALCRAFIERCAPLREPKMLLADKVLGVVAVGGFRNGGQEMAIEQIQAAMLCFGMIPVGGSAPAFQGGTVLSVKDDISGDTLGLDTARKLGVRVAETALRLAPKGA
jgi:multimeric flavodoxin WrbA